MIVQTEPFIDNSDNLYIKKVLKRKYLTEDKFTKKFEENIKNYVQSKYAISVSNWTLGLYACLQALNIGPGDEVIVPNITFIATSNSVIMAGAKVVLCDVNRDSMCIDTIEAKKKINSRTKAIIPVHLYGNACDMDELLLLKKNKNIKIIEDAAQAIGVKYKNKFVGTIGDCGGYSFYGNKIITTGEGGVVVTNNKLIADKIYRIKNHGRNKKGIFIHKEIGYNFMFTELQAAMGISQLKKLNNIIKKRKIIFDLYKKYLNKSIIKFNFKKTIRPLHWFVNIHTRFVKVIEKHLHSKKIMTRRLFYPLHLQPCYRRCKLVKNIQNKFPNSLYLYNNTISLPTFHRLSEVQIKKISYEINKKI